MNAPTPPGADMRDLFRAFLRSGPTTLLLDGHHPAHRGLPEGVVADILRIDFIANDDTVSAVDPDSFAMQYVKDSETTTARLVWEACFFVAGQSNADANTPQMTGRVSAWLPECLEPDRQANLHRLLGALGMGPQEREWRLEVSPALLADDANREAWCADKRAAVQRILAQPDGVALLWFAPGVRGVVLPAGLKAGDAGELPIGAAAGAHDVQVAPFAVAWSVDTPRGRQRITLPWRAVGAVRDARTALGWWWPRDLPPGPRAQFQTDADLWAVLQRLDGIPLAPPPPPPARPLQVVILQRPLSHDKPTALRMLLGMGTTLVLADPTVAGVRLPPSLPGRARVLMVPLHLPGLDPEAQWDDEGFRAKCPDYAGVVRDLWLPWRAVFLMSGTTGGVPHTWPEDFPPFLVAAQHALRAVARSEGGALPPELDVFDYKPHGDGLGLGLTVGADGRQVLVVGRPLGAQPPPPGAPAGQVYRSMLEFSFRLPAPVVQ